MNIGRIGGVLKKQTKRKGSDYWIGLEPTPANAATMHCVSTGVSIGDGDEVIANDSIPVAGLLGLDHRSFCCSRQRAKGEGTGIIARANGSISCRIDPDGIIPATAKEHLRQAAVWSTGSAAPR